MVNYRMFNSKVDIMLVHQDELGMFWQHDLRKYKNLAVYSTMTMADNPIYPSLDNHDPRYVHTVRTWQRLVGVQQAYRGITEILQEEHEKSIVSGPKAWQSPLNFDIWSPPSRCGATREISTTAPGRSPARSAGAARR